MRIIEMYKPPKSCVFFMLLASCSLFLFGCVSESEVTATQAIVGSQSTRSVDESLDNYVFATTSPGFVRIEGQLIVPDPLVVLPQPDGVFLIPVDSAVQTDRDIAKLGLDDALQADVDERTGEFVFPNVPVGRYAVTVKTTGDLNIPTHYTGSGENVILDITKEQLDTVVVLGRIRVP